MATTMPLYTRFRSLRIVSEVLAKVRSPQVAGLAQILGIYAIGQLCFPSPRAVSNVFAKMKWTMDIAIGIEPINCPVPLSVTSMERFCSGFSIIIGTVGAPTSSAQHLMPAIFSI